ncbi:phytoene/squalene synthase family protein [Cytophagaceae bacterium DM2B3-1]|uniref:Phytoene/squalene synthase family protein n=1 Tax=Xanthocytophaga flava TaxID=3048013 RepID=A0ABT7CLS0_9BACT|nr:phytoene/squalene synthase family protein [Xanthocytophaga flavus]MDJ1494699.1 phytoene/squalene synthase family protein [Xanthocytophaga flavus]
MQLYDQTTFECSKLITKCYSTSFTLGIKTLDKEFHLPIYAIYGFVRYADEIVDTFHGFDKKSLLERFKADTYRALEEKISLNPVLHSFQTVVHEYGIEYDLIDAFLKSMEMDLYETSYTRQGYEEYIYGSAEVVGLMCLYVFCKNDKEKYQQLKSSAQRLGAAFQKVNFLRDLKSDYIDRGRVYFPGIDFTIFNGKAKDTIEADIQADFDAAYEGIKQLPSGAKWGVYLAYIYYKALFKKIKRLPASQIMQERIRIPDPLKLVLWVQTYCKHKINYL